MYVQIPVPKKKRELKIKTIILVYDFLTLRYGFKAFSLFIEEF